MDRHKRGAVSAQSSIEDQMHPIERKEPALWRIVGNPASDLYGFVIVDEFIAGRATGGIRITADVSPHEVARLAHEMTLKFAWLRLPSGGAKAGLVIDPQLSEDDRQQRCRAFGAAIGDLLRSGRYVGGLDMGSGDQDLVAILDGAGVDHKPGGSDEPPAVDSNLFTALSVLSSIHALLESRGRTLQGSGILLEGLGKVGGHLIQLLDRAGARIAGVSTRAGAVYDPSGLAVSELLNLRLRYGDACVQHVPGQRFEDPAALFLQKADLLVPGGAPDSLNQSNLDQLAVSAIVPVANISATPDIEDALHTRGIDYIPGFVSNSGGVFCWYLGGLSQAAREQIILGGFANKVRRLITAADQAGCSIGAMARSQARQKLEAAKDRERGAPGARARDLLLKMSPRRLGYVLGSRLLGPAWAAQAPLLSRWYFDARYFR